jgi:hypothetical protein
MGGARSRSRRRDGEDKTGRHRQSRRPQRTAANGDRLPADEPAPPPWRTRLSVSAGRQPAEIAVDQIRAINKSRLGRRVGTLSDREATALRRLITEMYGE